MKKDEILKQAMEIVKIVANDKNSECKARLGAMALLKQIEKDNENEKQKDCD